MSAASTLAGRIGRHAVIYGGAGAATLLLGLVNVAVLTRLLAPAEFGQVATFLVFSSMLTIVYNLGSLQGGFRAAFGGTGDGEEIGTIDDDDPDAPEVDRPRALGAALCFTAALALAGTLVVAAFSGEIAHALLGD